MTPFIHALEEQMSSQSSALNRLLDRAVPKLRHQGYTLLGAQAGERLLT